MSLTHLLKSLDDDAARDLQALLAEQDRRAETIVDQARADADLLVSQARTDAAAVAHSQTRTVIDTAQADARRTLADALDDELASVLTAAQTRLHQLVDEPAGTEVTLRLLAQALEILPGATACRIHPRQATAAQHAHPALVVTGDLDCLGVVVSDERRSVDNTAPTRLASAWPDLQVRLARSWRST